ncbi:MAG: hypothetical protein IT208_00980 [Chthonomonadales bacterium]|nr:hypothetical protein [Chthonomonadales bacterium]
MGYGGPQEDMGRPAARAAPVSPADEDMAEWALALYVGLGGDVRLTTWRGDTATFSNVPSGSVLPVRARRVWSTGTTAGEIVALG